MTSFIGMGSPGPHSRAWLNTGLPTLARLEAPAKRMRMIQVPIPVLREGFVGCIRIRAQVDHSPDPGRVVVDRDRGNHFVHRVHPYGITGVCRIDVYSVAFDVDEFSVMSSCVLSRDSVSPPVPRSNS